MFFIKEELKKLPKKPGVYLMKNASGDIIYVGKAKNLYNRVRTYFNRNQKSAKIRALVSNISSFDYIIVDNEVESLVLESNLIKEYRPKYNVLLRDDKQYPYIKITNEEFPKLVKTRILKKDGAMYFGPFPNAMAVNDSIAMWTEFYKLRTCKISKDHPPKPCFNYYIDLCLGVCCGKVTIDEYNRQLKDVIDFLRGKNHRTIDILIEKMNEHAKNLEFEEALRFKIAVDAMLNLKEEQKITKPLSDSADFIAYARAEDLFLILVFYRRDGKMIAKDTFLFEDRENDNRELISQFLKLHYLTLEKPPKEIYIEIEPAEFDLIDDALKSKFTKIIVPQKGAKRNTIMMVKKNAIDELQKNRARLLKKTKANEVALDELAKIIGTGEYPSRIESFDISHIQGTDAVGGMVVFQDGYPNRNSYRRFKIKKANTRDDLDCMKEVLTRRFNRLVQGDFNFKTLPNLILMDGGKNQINVCKKILDLFGLDIPVIGMIKDATHTTKGIISENIEYLFKNTSELFKFITIVQNEVHRFAISYHKSLRSNKMIRSQLDGIKYIGPKRKKILMDTYGSIEKIKLQDIETLSHLPGMNEKAAKSVKEELNNYNLD